MNRRILWKAGLAVGASTLLSGGGWVWWSHTGRDVAPFPIEGKEPDANARLQLSSSGGAWIASVTIVAREPMVLDRWNLPTNGTVDNDVFVFKSGVRYTGIYAKRMITDADRMKLATGDTYSGTVELGRYYALPKGGVVLSSGADRTIELRPR